MKERREIDPVSYTIGRLEEGVNSLKIQATNIENLLKRDKDDTDKKFDKLSDKLDTTNEMLTKQRIRVGGLAFIVTGLVNYFIHLWKGGS